MPEPMKLEFEANLKEFVFEPSTWKFGQVAMMTFAKVDGFFTEDDLRKMAMRRFKVTLEEVKDW